MEPNISYMEKILKCSKYISAKESIVNAIKDTLRETNLSNYLTPLTAMNLAETTFSHLEDDDLTIYDQIYKYFEANQPLF